jgi:AcrR family transcriptional regulator
MQQISMPRPDTKAEIIRVATDLLAEGGPSALTFDAIAARIGKSKQAVLYWFPSKPHLLGSITIPALTAEAACLSPPAKSKLNAATAIRELAAFHLSDLDRFRLVYVSPQSGALRSNENSLEEVTQRVNQVTSALYDQLAECLRIDCPGLSEADARQDAMILHTSVLGLILMIAMAETIGDPLKHTSQALIERLAARYS